MKKMFIQRVTSVLLLSCFFTAGSTSPALAQTWSSSKTSSVNGIMYTYESAISTSGSSVEAETYISSEDGDVPTGYMGVQARLFKGNELYSSSDWEFNGSSTSSFQGSTGYVSGSGTFYSQGKVQMYNGSGFTTFFANQTSNVSVRNSSSLHADRIASSSIAYKVNSSGETYGSALYSDLLGGDPDLILARGIDGTQGYIRSADINKIAESPEDAVKNYSPSSYTIPLYDYTGNHIIGTFSIN